MKTMQNRSVHLKIFALVTSTSFFPLMVVSLLEIFCIKDLGPAESGATAIFLSMGLILSIFSGIFVSYAFIRPIQKFESAIGQSQTSSFKSKLVVDSDDELGSIANAFNSMIDDLYRYEHSLKNKVTENNTLKLARQVVHDIRSPVTVLEVLLEDSLSNVPEETRVLVRKQLERIQDIANNLLTRCKADLAETEEDSDSLKVESLSNALEEIISEKRVYLKKFQDLSIEADLYSGQFGVFSQINLSQFKRVCSNLINNAVEALPSGSGVIRIKLSSQDDDQYLTVSISDNGKGIPSDKLATLGQEGQSFGKTKGNGIGLFHAFQTIRAWGGDVTIDSAEGKGTCVTLKLKKEAAPLWFSSKLRFSPTQKVVILDDDKGIHDLWAKRLKEFSFLKIFHFTDPKEFEIWLRHELALGQTPLCLSDFELLGYTKSGLDLLEEHALKAAILVTSHSENKSVKSRCEKMGIKLLPKKMAPFIPIEIS